MSTKLVRESLSFTRGQEPKKSLGIGMYANPEKRKQAQIHVYKHSNWARKPTDLEEVHSSSYLTQVTPELADILNYIDIIPPEVFTLSSQTFNHQNYKDPNNEKVLISQEVPEEFSGEIYGVYADNEIDEGANYLMDTQGSDYPRYVTRID